MSLVKIFWHLGLERTGTTFLQKEIFPRLKGVEFVRKQDFKSFDTVYDQQSDRPYLLSFELGRQFDIQVKAFSEKYPETIPILVLRKHGDFIASQYKRAVKNGYPKSFGEFFNLDDNNSEYDRSSLNYEDKIQLLTDCFKSKPIILFYEELVKNKNGFLKQLTDEIDCTLPDAPLKKRHISYSDRQLSFLLKFNRKTNLRSSYKGPTIWKKPRSIMLKVIRYSLLQVGRLSKEKILVTDLELKEIDDYFSEDWKKCLSLTETIDTSIS